MSGRRRGGGGELTCSNLSGFHLGISSWGGGGGGKLTDHDSEGRAISLGGGGGSWVSLGGKLCCLGGKLPLRPPPPLR